MTRNTTNFIRKAKENINKLESRMGIDLQILKETLDKIDEADPMDPVINIFDSRNTLPGQEGLMGYIGSLDREKRVRFSPQGHKINRPALSVRYVDDSVRSIHSDGKKFRRAGYTTDTAPVYLLDQTFVGPREIDTGLEKLSIDKSEFFNLITEKYPDNVVNDYKSFLR